MTKLQVSLFGILRLRYSYVRLQWLLVAVAGMTVLTLSAQELWGGNTSGLAYIINPFLFYLYVVLFAIAILLTNAMDFKKICDRKPLAILCSVISMLFDVGLLFALELLVLLTINQFSADILGSMASTVLIVLPLSLGEITLSSLTVEYLKKRAEQLFNESKSLRNEAESLEERIRAAEQRLVNFQEEERKFSKSLKREKDGEKGAQ